MAKLNPVELAAEIVASFVSNNSLPRGELPALIEAVHSAVKGLAEGNEVAAAIAEPPAPAVSIRKSITPDYLICLEDGKKFKSLRRHLTTLGMTPEQYREKWNLPSTYPMVAANYSAQRSTLAKDIGLGQLRGRHIEAAPAAAETGEDAPEAANDDTFKAMAPEPASAIQEAALAAPPAWVEPIEVAAPEPTSVAEEEVVAAPSAKVETFEAAAPKQAGVAKRKAKAKAEPEAIVEPTAEPAERKRGRPRKATAE